MQQTLGEQAPLQQQRNAQSDQVWLFLLFDFEPLCPFSAISDNSRFSHYYSSATMQSLLNFQHYRFRNHIPLPPVQQLRFSSYDSGLVFNFIYIGFISGLFWVGLGLFKVGLGLVYGLCEFIEGFPLVVEPDVPLKPFCKYVPFSFQV